MTTPTTIRFNGKLKFENVRLRTWALRSLAAAILMCHSVQAADIVWDGGTAGTGTAWTTAANWNPDGVPTSADNAIFDSVQGVTLYTVNNTSQQVGSITIGPGRTSSFSIRSLSSAAGTLVLNGVGGILLSNASSTATVTFTNSSAGPTILTLSLAASGDVYCGSTIQIYSTINETGGSRSITKSGSGNLYLRGTNSFSGSTTVNVGDLEVDDVGTIGNGTGTLYLSGGNLLSGASRNGTSASAPPIANPIVITTDAYIQNKAGTATTRYLALSGTLGGSAGTLKIADPTTQPGNTFAVRLFGSGFTFNRPMIVGESGYDLSSAFSVLEIANTNGTQTFNGDISGVGSIRRINPYGSSLPAGTTVFAGNNTYSGGTLISSGTLLANNTVGSALGSGAVTVTNFGILGGNGSVLASTAVSGNGTIAPGASATSVGNLTVSDLTLGAGANYNWQITSATGTAGVDWDLITASSDWIDAGSSGNPITIRVDSLGAPPAGWNSTIARDWVIVQSSSASGFDASHFALDTTAFSGTIGGVFSLSVVGNSLHLIYTPAADTEIKVPSGSVMQGQTSPTPYPVINVAGGIVKVGNGEVVLTNLLNSYPGSTKIYAGTASLAVDALNNSGAFGAASTAVLLGDVSGNSNATVNINTAGVTLGRSVVVQTGSSGSKTLGTTITSGLATFSGDVALQDNAALTAPGGGSALFSGNFTGTGGLTLGGGGAITLAAVNSYSGTTTLTGGTLNLNAKALGTNTFTISAVSTLDNTAVSSVTLNDCPQNWNANFTFTGTTNLNLGSGPVTMSSTRTLTVNNSTLTVGGTIAGNGGLVKLGAGTLSIGSPTTNTYTGGTTNSAGVIAINGTASFGDGTGTLALNGGSILNTGSRSGSPIANPVVMSADTTIYGNSTLTSSRILPFSGNWTVAGSTLRVGNIGISNNTFLVRLTAGNNMTWPVVVGDPAFDTPGAISALEFYNDNTTPVQTVTGLIAGNGQVWRGHVTAGLGGTSIFIGNNTYAGGTVLGSGTLGIGNDSTPTSGTLTSGPLGTGTLEIDYDPSLFIYASGGLRTIGNSIFLNSSGNSAFNVVFTGTNALTLTGNVNVGGLPKTLTVSNTAAVTFSGVMTNTAAITKAGPGKLIFSGDNSSRTNNTTVNAGTLLVNNSTGSGTGSGNVTVNSGGTLGGTGTIAGAVTVNAGGTLSAGASIGTLTINSNLTLAGNVVVEVNTSASPSNDLIVVTGVLTNTGTGTITVSNLGPALAVGNNFQIFSGAVANGSALTVTGGGMNWTNRLETDGSIQALSVTTVQTPNFTTGSFSVLPGGNVSLTATGAIGATYKLWATTNLALAPVTNTWTLLQSGTVSANPFTLQDLTATNFPQRFYIFTAP